jgi:hypothetical protein
MTSKSLPSINDQADRLVNTQNQLKTLTAHIPDGITVQGLRPFADDLFCLHYDDLTANKMTSSALIQKISNTSTTANKIKSSTAQTPQNQERHSKESKRPRNRS